MNALESPSTRPYLIRAMYEWCTDHSFTPYVAVKVDGSVQVPREFVQGGEIVLNISFDATSSLQLGNEFIEFKARFGGKPRDIMVPIHRVMAIYARENGQGMSFPVTDSPLGQTVVGMDQLNKPSSKPESVMSVVPSGSSGAAGAAASSEGDDNPVPPTPAPTRPTLTRIK
jgi:stringent starvation protein B